MTRDFSSLRLCSLPPAPLSTATSPDAETPSRHRPDQNPSTRSMVRSPLHRPQLRGPHEQNLQPRHDRRSPSPHLRRERSHRHVPCRRQSYPSTAACIFGWVRVGMRRRPCEHRHQFIVADGCRTSPQRHLANRGLIPKLRFRRKSQAPRLVSHPTQLAVEVFGPVWPARVDGARRCRSQACPCSQRSKPVIHFGNEVLKRLREQAAQTVHLRMASVPHRSRSRGTASARSSSPQPQQSGCRPPDRRPRNCPAATGNLLEAPAAERPLNSVRSRRLLLERFRSDSSDTTPMSNKGVVPVHLACSDSRLALDPG